MEVFVESSFEDSEIGLRTDSVITDALVEKVVSTTGALLAIAATADSLDLETISGETGDGTGMIPRRGDGKTCKAEECQITGRCGEHICSENGVMEVSSRARQMDRSVNPGVVIGGFVEEMWSNVRIHEMLYRTDRWATWRDRRKAIRHHLNLSRVHVTKRPGSGPGLLVSCKTKPPRRCSRTVQL